MSVGRDIPLNDASLLRIAHAFDAVEPLIGEHRGSAPCVPPNCRHGMKSAFEFGEGNDNHDNVLTRTRTVLDRRPRAGGQRCARGGRGRVASATGDAGSSCGSNQRRACNRLRRATRNKIERSARCAAASGTVRMPPAALKSPLPANLLPAGFFFPVSNPCARLLGRSSPVTPRPPCAVAPGGIACRPQAAIRVRSHPRACGSVRPPHRLRFASVQLSASERDSRLLACPSRFAPRGPCSPLARSPSSPLTPLRVP